MSDWPTYEIFLPLGFDMSKFTRESERGENHLWLICLDDEPGIKRFKGVITGHNVRVFVDIFSLPQKTKDLQRAMFVTTPHYQNLSAKQAADLIFYEVRGTKMYHDGQEVTP
ncbi:MAG: hypothetical protein PHC39_04785 [Proteiniphilum sp.]|nr:hypothetical protein [Proteiniphilum sp.]